MNALVSVIMPSFNTAKYIAETIDSVLAQTYQNWELIIVDDCSTDNTDEVVGKYLTDTRIKYLKNEQNSGAAASRNKALREAKGKWIAFLDSDDFWEPEKLQKQIGFMEETGHKFTYTDYKLINENGDYLPYVITAPKKITKRKLYNYCYVGIITVMYDSDAIGLIQIAEVEKNNDYAMWFQAIEKTAFYHLPESLSIHRRRTNSLTSGSKLKLIKHHYLLFRKVLKKSSFVSVVLTVNNLFFGLLKKLFYRKRLK